MKSSFSFFLRCLILLIGSAAVHPLPTTADDAPLSDVELLVRRIESRSNAWIAYQARLSLVLTNAKNENGRCRCDLTYDRLNEKMLLRCSDNRDELLFIFRTADTAFELYLRPQQTVYRGNIFQMEDTTGIESHLEPLALYRSLKLMAIPEASAEISSEEQNAVTLSLWTRKGGLKYVSRMITADAEANVITEGYYNPDRIARTQIDRSDFRSIKDDDSLTEGPVYFPYRIHLLTRDSDGGNEKTTAMTFEKISLRPSVDRPVWDISYPPKTRFIDL